MEIRWMDGTEVNTSAIVPGGTRFETGDLLTIKSSTSSHPFAHPYMHWASRVR